jgi:ADP-heptose:LPS heptosyltransferase
VLRASRIGDWLCATPALRALRRALPQAEISLVTLPMLHDLARRSPHIDRVFDFPGYPGIAEQLFDARRAAKFFQEIQSGNIDLAIQMQGSGVFSNPFALMLGARYTAGFVRPGDPPGLLDAALVLPNHGHEVQRLLSLTTFLGAQADGEQTEFPLWPEDHSAADRLLSEAPPPWFGLHPAARDLTRRWSIERFAEVGKVLQKRYGATLVLLGEAQEKDNAAQLEREIRGRVLNLVGRTSLPVLGAVIQRLSLLLTNDSGPAHIAYALGAPTLTVFGGGDPQRYGALPAGPFRMLVHEVPCRPCTYHECPIGYVCLEHVSVAQALEAAGELLEAPTAEGRPHRS